MTMHRPSLRERLEERIIPEPNSGCHLWLGSVNPNGYGKMKDGPKGVAVHRLAWELHHGRPIPAGMYVCHKCDVPSCVNPDHLFLGTSRDNALDRSSKGRSFRPKGELHPRSKLTPKVAERIRHSTLTTATMAEIVGVSVATIRRVRSGRSWRP